jgi:transglutaminase-like putative cysteine protease
MPSDWLKTPDATPDGLPPIQPGWLSRLQQARDGMRAAIRTGWSWLFGNLPGGWGVSWLLATLLAACIGGSTATAGWVPGSDAAGVAAFFGALAGGGLALVRRLPSPVGLPAAILAGLPIAAQRADLDLVRQSIGALAAGDLAHAGAVFLFLVALLLWAVGAWLAWCAIRWRQPLLGLVPGVAIFATNLLNFPTGQNSYVFYFAALTVALLLWSAYRRSLDQAARRGLRLTSDSRWDFWESGAVAGIGLLVVAFFAPPLSTVDRTVDAQTGLIKAWSNIQLELHHALPSGDTNAGAFSTGFSDQVVLGHPLTRNSTIVFTYKPLDSHSTPLYFEGVAAPATVSGVWRTSTIPPTKDLLPSDTPVLYEEDSSDLKTVAVTIHLQRPPSSDRTIFFFPGQLVSINRPALITHDETGPVGVVQQAETLARTAAGTYTVTGSYSGATEAALRGAGSDYPDWAAQYAGFDAWTPAAVRSPYRDPAVEKQIQDLARQVTKGTTNAFDAATAIETFLRTKYKYTLKPPPTPPGQDPLAFFLFVSKQGYCEYFASAMGDMMRSLGIPVQLVNGYGPGTFDNRTQTFVVRESDAHTWVQVYFPQYGWVPFEPTPDGTYEPLPRGNTVACAFDSPLCDPAAAAASALGIGANRKEVNDPPGDTPVGSKPVPVAAPSGFHIPFNLVPWLLAVLGVLVAAALAVAVMLLTPRTPGSAWRRTQLLSRLVGVPVLPSETPLEFGRRLARALPKAAAAADSLAAAFTRTAYGPPEMALQGAHEVLISWHSLRPVLLREAAARAARRR